MKAVITGGTGLVGSHLTQTLMEAGYAVDIFTRSKRSSTREKLRYLAWPADDEGRKAVLQADVVFNLAGAPVAQRWTAQSKQEILDSRVDTTNAIVDLLQGSKAVLVSASAIGLYPDHEFESSESTSPSRGFLSDVVLAWEAAAIEAQKNGTRVVCLRIGLVLAKDGGALDRLTPLFKLGLGSAVGNGKHWQSWIHVEDLARVMQFAAENTTISGIYNAVAPNPVSNQTLSRAMAKAMKKPFFLPPVPGFMLRLIFGDMSQVILASQKVSSKKIETNGFTFKYPTIDSAMKAIFSPT